MTIQSHDMIRNIFIPFLAYSSPLFPFYHSVIPFLQYSIFILIAFQKEKNLNYKEVQFLYYWHFNVPQLFECVNQRQMTWCWTVPFLHNDASLSHFSIWKACTRFYIYSPFIVFHFTIFICCVYFFAFPFLFF